MSYIEEMLEFNKKFVENIEYVPDADVSKRPKKKMAIVACMDTRLVRLLPAALNLKDGDAKIIKNAGAVVNYPFGDIMRSLFIAVYELGVEDIVVIGHYDCGVQGLEASQLIQKMKARNIEQEKFDTLAYYGIDVNKWLKGFDKVENSVLDTVNIIKNHPLMPADVRVHGFVMDPSNGRLDKVVS